MTKRSSKNVLMENKSNKSVLMDKKSSKNVLMEIVRAQFRVKSLYPKTFDRNAPRRDPIYVASSFTYAVLAVLVYFSTNVPAYTVINENFTKLMFSIALVFQSFCTYNSDVVHIGHPSLFHSFDRLFASLMTLSFGLNIWFVPNDERMMFLMVVPLSVSLLCRSRISRIRGLNHRDFLFWHSCWHYHLPLNTALWILIRQPNASRPMYLLLCMVFNLAACILHIYYPTK